MDMVCTPVADKPLVYRCLYGIVLREKQTLKVNTACQRTFLYVVSPDASYVAVSTMTKTSRYGENPEFSQS